MPAPESPPDDPLAHRALQALSEAPPVEVLGEALEAEPREGGPLKDGLERAEPREGGPLKEGLEGAEPRDGGPLKEGLERAEPGQEPARRPASPSGAGPDDLPSRPWVRSGSEGRETVKEAAPKEQAPRRTPGLLALGAATMGANLVAVAFTVVFTRLLGTGGYGALAALMNLTVILFVAGNALQVAAAREGSLGRLGQGGELAATLDRWTRQVTIALAGVALASALLREPLSAILNVEQAWAAAAVPLTAGLWLLVCLQRGLLQAAQAYRAVGWNIGLEALGRLAAGALLVALGLGVTGAYLGTLASLAIASVVLAAVLRRRLGAPTSHAPRHPLRALARDAAVPIGALTIVAALQNVDVIMARHALDEDAAGIYAAATVAAKAVVWIAVGLGLYVLPEAVRRAAAGLDPRTVLLRGLAVVGAISAIALAAFAAVPELLLRTAFGAEYEAGADVLLPLGAAFALLAGAYLGVQFLLGLRHRGFALILLVAAAIEPVLLASADDLETFADTVLAVQAAAAACVLGLALRIGPRPAVVAAAPST